MIAASITLWIIGLALYLKHRWERGHDATINRMARDEFAKRVKYIRFLETTTPAKCERCNHKRRLRGVLTLARLCEPCQIELGLRETY